MANGEKMNKVIYLWHAKLDMPKHDLVWHTQDVADELQELIEAKGLSGRWSELSDISYTYTRALWSGHEDISLPISKFKYRIGLIYMFPKYELRWKFFSELGKKLDPKVKVREVRNPKKAHKLKDIAQKYGFDQEQFADEAKKLMKSRFFFK